MTATSVPRVTAKPIKLQPKCSRRLKVIALLYRLLRRETPVLALNRRAVHG
jgi:hypothetical protein